MRAFVVGGGDRALALARELRARGDAVRLVVDSPDAETEGAEPWVGTPDRIGTLRDGLDSVTILLWLQGDCDRPEIHGSRLAMMLERTTDTTVRGVVYETGSAHEAAGLHEMEEARRKNEIHFRTVDRRSPDWLGDVGRAIDELLVARVPT